MERTLDLFKNLPKKPSAGRKKTRRKHLAIYIDGASRGNPGPAGIGVVIRDEEGKLLLRSSRGIGTATNNVAEYRALIAALTEAAAFSPAHVEVFSDSELLVRQVRGEYRVKNADLKKLFEKVKALLSPLGSFTISHVAREENREADRLASQATRRLSRKPG